MLCYPQISDAEEEEEIDVQLGYNFTMLLARRGVFEDMLCAVTAFSLIHSSLGKDELTFLPWSKGYTQLGFCIEARSHPLFSVEDTLPFPKSRYSNKKIPSPTSQFNNYPGLMHHPEHHMEQVTH